MRVLIAAVGKAKATPEQSLYQHYIKRIPWKIACKELAKDASGQQLLDACKGAARLVALDEAGMQVSSSQIAQQIGNWQQQGDSSIAFIIGGADGLDDAVRRQADAVWSLGRVTWPHMLVRGLLAEQLYRAHCILTNHPYHRE